jgi:hypothetical protein
MFAILREQPRFRLPQKPKNRGYFAEMRKICPQMKDFAYIRRN